MMTTPDDDLIERVAEGQAKFDGRSLQSMPRFERERYMQRARLAVGDMREPTEAMIDCSTPDNRDWNDLSAEMVWGFMIDAALNPAPAKPDGDA